MFCIFKDHTLKLTVRASSIATCMPMNKIKLHVHVLNYFIAFTDVGSGLITKYHTNSSSINSKCQLAREMDRLFQSNQVTSMFFCDCFVILWCQLAHFRSKNNSIIAGMANKIRHTLYMCVQKYRSLKILVHGWSWGILGVLKLCICFVLLYHRSHRVYFFVTKFGI